MPCRRLRPTARNSRDRRQHPEPTAESPQEITSLRAILRIATAGFIVLADRHQRRGADDYVARDSENHPAVERLRHARPARPVGHEGTHGHRVVHLGRRSAGIEHDRQTDDDRRVRSDHFLGHAPRLGGRSIDLPARLALARRGAPRQGRRERPDRHVAVTRACS